MRMTVTTGLVALTLALALIAGSSNASAASVSSCVPGQVKSVKSGSGGGYWGAKTKRAYDRAVQLGVAGDNYGLKRLLLSGKFVWMRAGTRLRVLTIDSTHVEARIVRARVRQIVHVIVWVDCGWLK
jgi:hypothetical protein